MIGTASLVCIPLRLVLSTCRNSMVRRIEGHGTLDARAQAIPEISELRATAGGPASNVSDNHLRSSRPTVRGSPSRTRDILVGTFTKHRSETDSHDTS